MSCSEGLGAFSSKEGDPVEVHYNPCNPSFCWAKAPGTGRSLARMLPLITKVGALLSGIGCVLLVAGLLLR